MTPGWSLQRGARLGPDGACRFSVWAPRVPRMTVRLVGRCGAEHPLERGADGVHRAELTDVGPGEEYVLRLEGERDRPDPVSRAQPHGVHGPSALVDPAAFAWSDGGWQGVRPEDLVFYELHVGTFTRDGTFDAVVERLPALAELGVTALELMPVAAFPGARNWGYDGVHPYAPQATYGGPDGLKRLVDAAHRAGMAIFLDVVYNHFGPEGNYLAEFGPYFTERYHTPWGSAVNFDGPDSTEVRRYVVDNALYWVTEFHIDGLRLDAVHAIFDASPRHILAELAAAVHDEAERLGRRAYVMAESDANDARLVRPPGDRGFGLDALWNEDFHHAVHALLTGERDGYYQDFGEIEQLGRVVRDRFFLAGRLSHYRGGTHGTPADDVSPLRFVHFVQNHDQVGNRAVGDRLARLVPPESQRLAAALLLLTPSLPLLFMGEEYGETNPFLYFVSHGDPGLVEAVREGRRREFAAFGWTGEIPDPQSEVTFERSRLSWDYERQPERGALRGLYGDLLALRREEGALRPGAAVPVVRWDTAAEWLSVRLAARGCATLLAVFNPAAGARSVALEPPDDGRWSLRFWTEHERYGGYGIAPRPSEDGGVTLSARSAALYREERR